MKRYQEIRKLKNEETLGNLESEKHGETPDNPEIEKENPWNLYLQEI